MTHRSIYMQALVTLLVVVFFGGLFMPAGVVAGEPKKLYGLMSPKEIREHRERQRTKIMMRWDEVQQEQEAIRGDVELIAAALIKLDALEERIRLLKARAGEGAKELHQPGGSTDIDAVRRNRDLYLHEVKTKLPTPMDDYGQIREYMRTLAGKWYGLMDECIRLHEALWAEYQPTSPKEGASHWDAKEEAPLQERRHFFIQERFELTRALGDPRMLFLSRYEPGKFPFVMPSLLYWYGVSIAPRKEAVEMFNKKMKESGEAKREFYEKYLPAMDERIEALKKQAAEAEGENVQ